MLALDIVDHLIASAPGQWSYDVITFLWKLKGNALTMIGRVDEAELLLVAAIDNAQAQGERFLLWDTQASLGHLYRTMNRQNKAQQTVSTAHELIKELADTIQDKVLQDNFLQHAQAMETITNRVLAADILKPPAAYLLYAGHSPSGRDTILQTCCIAHRLEF
jgi:tetratricopeptide (TPR) repeat protein